MNNTHFGQTLLREKKENTNKLIKHVLMGTKDGAGGGKRGRECTRIVTQLMRSIPHGILLYHILHILSSYTHKVREYT